MDIESILVKRKKGRPCLDPLVKEQRKQERCELNKLKNNESRRRTYIAKALQNPNHKFLTNYTEEEKQAAIAQKERGKGRPKLYFTIEEKKQVCRTTQSRINAEKKKAQDILIQFIEGKKDEFKRFIENKI